MFEVLVQTENCLILERDSLIYPVIIILTGDNIYLLRQDSWEERRFCEIGGKVYAFIPPYEYEVQDSSLVRSSIPEYWHEPDLSGPLGYGISYGGVTLTYWGQTAIIDGKMHFVGPVRFLSGLSDCQSFVASCEVYYMSGSIPVVVAFGKVGIYGPGGIERELSGVPGSGVGGNYVSGYLTSEDGVWSLSGERLSNYGISAGETYRAWIEWPYFYYYPKDPYTGGGLRRRNLNTGAFEVLIYPRDLLEESYEVILENLVFAKHNEALSPSGAGSYGWRCAYFSGGKGYVNGKERNTTFKGYAFQDFVGYRRSALGSFSNGKVLGVGTAKEVAESSEVKDYRVFPQTSDILHASCFAYLKMEDFVLGRVR